MTKQFLLNQLVEIAGGPNEVHKLNNFGSPITIWIWDIKFGLSNRRTRSQLLVMSDKAQDLGLDFYRMKKVGMRKFQLTDKLNEVARVAVWHKEK